MSKYRYLKELLREAYPLYNPKLAEQVMKRVKEIRDAEKEKKSS